MEHNDTAHSSTRLNWPHIRFVIFLLLPSTGVVQKYLGMTGVVIYVGIASLLLWLGWRSGYPRFAAKVTERQTYWLAAGTFILLAIIFFLLYPIANSGVVGPGSDRDEALNIATEELLNGRYPYYARPYTGNPISPMPGSLLLAIPFVLIGNSAYQNLFWLFAFLLSINVFLNNRKLAISLLWVILAFSPAVMNEFVTGGDFLANSIYVFLFVLWLTRAISDQDSHPWKIVLLAALLGFGLASRANFIFIVPIVSFSLARRANWKTAIRTGAIVFLSFCLVMIPFYLYDPEGFTPLNTANKLGQFDAVLPLAGIILPLITGMLAVALSFHPKNGDLHILFKHCAFVLAFPVVSGIVLQSIASGSFDLRFAVFGLSFLFFGTAACSAAASTGNAR